MKERINIMKKIVSLAVLAALTTTVADAAPSYIKRDARGGYDVTYDYTDKAKNGWYVGGHVALNLMNWENEYTTDAPNAAELTDDKYSFEPVFGGDLFVGKTFNYFWRAELEGGLLGQFEDEGNGTTFKMTIPYLMANGYYDFTNGLYVGAGLGIAMPTTELDGTIFVGGDRKEQTLSPMMGIMLGYAHELDYNLTLDVRYRLAGLMGTDHERIDTAGYAFKNEIGLILDNSISVGIRYNF
jgi:opacity protein-like surface antigen